MIKNKITLKQIEALVYVANLGTFRSAAAALGTTQPNISVRIAAMEETLGVVLMHRDASAVRFTEKGAEILAAARDILRSTETLLDVAGRRDLVEEKLRLGVTELVAATWLQDFLRALKGVYPALRVELTVDLSRILEEQMHSGELDLGVLTGRIAHKSFTALPLGSYRYGWFAAPQTGGDLGRHPAFSDLMERGLLTHGKHTLASRTLRDHIAGQGLPLDRITHCSSLTALLHMAADGMGVALLPRQICAAYLQSGQLIEVECTWVSEPLTFVTCYNTDTAAHYVEQAAAMVTEVATGH